MGKIIDLTGNRYGRLTVIKMAYRNENRKYYWLCKCDCGNEKTVAGYSLKCGDTQSCGCLGKEHRTKSLIKHNMTHTKLYRVWGNMKARCYIKSSSRYYRYGARGITVCDEWKNSFDAFQEWAMKNGYKEDLTIDRIDVNGNYEPSNCRWATVKEQMNNYSRNHFLEYNGKNQTITEWAEELNINKGTIKSRLKAGWSIERTLTEKAFIGKNQSYYKGGDE